MKRVNIFEDFIKSKWYESVRKSIENAYPNFWGQIDPIPFEIQDRTTPIPKDSEGTKYVVFPQEYPPMFPSPDYNYDEWMKDAMRHYWEMMRNTPPVESSKKEVEEPKDFNKTTREFIDKMDAMSKKKSHLIDMINHPPHYTSGKIEVWDFIIDHGLDFVLGNVIKYVCRAGRKGNRLEDLRKAKAYLEKAISLYEGDNA